MSLSLSEIIVPTFIGGLKTLDGVVDRAVAHADEKGIEHAVLLEARLYEDMFNFTKQIQTAGDIARRGIERLSGKELSSVEDDESSFADLKARIASTMDAVKSADTGAVDRIEAEKVTLSFGPMKLDFTGRSYVMTYAVPNFLFHVTTAYDIMRHNGVELGKRDFLGPFIAG